MTNYIQEHLKKQLNKLNHELKNAKENKEIISTFIIQVENIPPIVLDALKKEMKKLDSTIKICQMRLKNYE